MRKWVVVKDDIKRKTSLYIRGILYLSLPYFLEGSGALKTKLVALENHFLYVHLKTSSVSGEHSTLKLIQSKTAYQKNGMFIKFKC